MRRSRRTVDRLLVARGRVAPVSNRCNRPLKNRTPKGFSLAETAVAIALVGGLLVVALNLVGDATLGQQWTGDRSRGQLLAAALMSEILAQDYEDPDTIDGESAFDFTSASQMTSSPPLGRDSGESGGIRLGFDDVDDYDGWTASPPEQRDGMAIPNLNGWRRTAVVVWVNSTKLNLTLPVATGVKRVTVTVTHNDVPVAELVAIRTVGLPPPSNPLKVLFVVTDPAALTPQESARVTLMQSWGFTVALIAASATQVDFDTAVATADTAYVSEQVNALDLTTKLRDVTIGVVNEKAELVVVFGFSAWTHFASRDQIEVVDNTHYITSTLATGFITILSLTQPVHMLHAGSIPPGLQTLARTHRDANKYRPSLAVLETDAKLLFGATAAGRRVELPWGDAGFDINTLNADGQTIMKRAIEWAAGREQP